MDIDQLQIKLGGTSRYQWSLVIAVSLLTWTEMMDQTSVFFSAVPEHKCKLPHMNGEDGLICNNYTKKDEKKMTPFDNNTQARDQCHRYDINISNCEDISKWIASDSPNKKIIKCDKGYDYDTTYYQSTTITKWNMVCDQRIFDTIAIVMYFAGVGIGSLLVGTLMDKVGRKKCMLIFTGNIVLFGTLTSFAQSYWVYILLRLLTGMSDTVYVAVFAYVVEVSDKQSKTAVESYTILFGAVSHIALPGIAYFLRDWWKIGLVASLTPSVFFVVYFFIPESPRWLLSKQKDSQAKLFYEKCARSNNVTWREEDWNTTLEFERRMRNVSGKKKASILDLFRHKYLRIITLNTMFCWFVISILFEGLVINVATLAGDPYINSTLNALVEWVAYATYSLVVFRINKKRLFLSGCFVLAGLCCIIAMLLFQYNSGSEGLKMASTAFAISGKFFASSAFAFYYVLSNELFPTVLRGTGMSVASIAARIGAMLMPFILLLQTSVPWLTQTVFGVLAFCAAATSLLFPDTSNMKMLTGIDEAEKFYSENMHVLNKIV